MIYAAGGGLTSTPWRITLSLWGTMRAGESDQRGGPSYAAMPREWTTAVLNPTLSELVAIADGIWREAPPRSPPNPTTSYGEVLAMRDGGETFLRDGYGPFRSGAAQTLIARLREIASRFPTARATINADEVLLDPQIDAVVIATPSVTHATLVSRALAAGKHVLVEKPFALNPEEGEQLVAQARRSGVTLLVGHVYEYNPAIERMRELVASHSLGQTYYVESRRTNLGPIREDVNALWDLARVGAYVRLRDWRELLRERTSRRRIRHAELSPWDRGSHQCELARSQEGPGNHRGRLLPDAGFRRSEHARTCSHL
jgi:hypothetical protein